MNRSILPLKLDPSNHQQILQRQQLLFTTQPSISLSDFFRYYRAGLVPHFSFKFLHHLCYLLHPCPFCKTPCLDTSTPEFIKRIFAWLLLKFTKFLTAFATSLSSLLSFDILGFLVEPCYQTLHMLDSWML